MEERKTIGEKILARLRNSDRVGARLAVSRSAFDDRFERYGRPRGMSRFGMSLFPDHHSEVASSPTWDRNDDVEYLSGASYWARMQRLGNARLRRERRFAALENRFGQRRQLSARRRAPDFGSFSGERSIPFFGLSALALDDLAVLMPDNKSAESDSQAVSAWGEKVSKSEWKGAPVSDSPWLTGTSAPARVAARKRQDERATPLERIVQRAPATVEQVQQVRRVIERLVEPAAGLKKEASELQFSASNTNKERRLQRVQKARQNPVRAAAWDLESALPDDFLPPSRHAKGRLREPSGRRRGLRPVMSTSPLMTALDPVPSEYIDSSNTLDAVEREAAPRTRPLGAAGQTTARRVAHRVDDATPSSLLSSSPVRKPSLVAPSAVTIQPRADLQDLASAEEQLGSVGVPSGSVSRTRAVSSESPAFHAPDSATEQPAPASTPSAPMVRALARSQAPEEPLIERPLGKRMPVASRPVQTRSGMFAPERLVLTPDVDPVEVTADAVPAVAERVAQRNTAASHAAMRSERAFASNKLAEPTVVGRKAVADSVGDSEETSLVSAAQKASPAKGTRRHRIVRTASGSYAPESVVLSAAQDGGMETESTGSEVQPSVRGEKQTMVSHAAERLGSAETSKVTGAKSRIRPQAMDTSVLVPALPKSGEEEPPGMHAASRANKNPVVGYTAAKAVRNIQQQMSEQRSHVAPRRSLNPVRHASITRKHRLSADKNAVSITLPQQSVVASENRATGGVPDLDRTALAAEIRTVQASREYSGRPLDWSNARIEVMQVPVQPATPASQTDPVRMVRNESGAYVPAQSLRGSTRPTQASADQGVLPTVTDSDRANDELDTDDSRSMSPSTRRTGFSNTVEGVGAGQVHTGMPIWAHRATGMPRIRGAEDLVTELARASAPSDVVEILMNKSDGMAKATSALPQPVIQVIQQLKTEASRTEVELQREASEESTRERVRGRGGVRSTTRVARGMTGLSPRGPSSRGATAGMDKVSKLAQRLQELIAMAESQNRAGARREVRMAEDSAAAKSEGQSAAGAPESGRDVSVDIETLAREVTEQVTRELEMRRERRQEDPDGRSIWW